MFNKKETNYIVKTKIEEHRSMLHCESIKLSSMFHIYFIMTPLLKTLSDAEKK